MNEGAFWRSRLYPKLRKLGHFERVENAVGNGTPDVDYCISGHAGKIELKYAALPKRDTTPVLTAKNGMRVSQLAWIKRRMKAGGVIWVLVGAGEQTWLIGGDRAHEINGATQEQLIMMCCEHWPGAIDFEALAARLIRPLYIGAKK